MQILVVDDSRTMRMLVTRTLRQAGYGGHSIVEAADGIEALEVIDSVGADIILCDWNMPRMSGLELLQTLRGHGDMRPFGFVTSEGTPAMREVAEAEGANFVITKPFTPDVFNAVLGGVGARGTGGHPRQSVPTAHHLLTVLDTLIGRAVTTRDSGLMITPDSAALIWSYVFSDGGLAAAGAIDMSLAAILSTGIGLLPQGRITDAIEAGALEEDLEENLREVFNVLVALYTPMSDEHIGFGQLWHRNDVIPPEVAELLTCRTRRLDAVVSVGGYGEGCLSAIPAWRLVRSEVPA